jgi:PIN domain nuclease of toxin-antitoxin system
LARYLIDSHIFFWAIDAPERLLGPERAVIENPAEDIAVSVASFWELSINLAKGTLGLSPGKAPIGPDYFSKQAAIAGFAVLPIEAAEAEHVRSLPRIHGDPFDRLLVAQGVLSRRVILTRDDVFARYPGVQVFVP